MFGIDFVYKGFELVPLITALVMLAQHFGLGDYWADWLRAGLYGAAAVLIQFNAGVEDPAMLVLNTVSVVLLTRGIWPEGRGLLQGWQGRSGFRVALQDDGTLRRF